MHPLEGDWIVPLPNPKDWRTEALGTQDKQICTRQVPVQM
jgi:hypothetical protein